MGCPWSTLLVLVSFSESGRICGIHRLFLSTVVIKIIMGVRLLSYATKRRAGMEARAVADVVNDFGRDPIGEGKEERVRFHFHCFWMGQVNACTPLSQKYNRDLKTLLDNRQDNAEPVAEIGERRARDGGDDGNGKKKRLTLEEITRFTMVKRIW